MLLRCEAVEATARGIFVAQQLRSVQGRVSSHAGWRSLLSAERHQNRRSATVLSTPLVHHAAWLSSTPRYSNAAIAAVKDRYEQKYADRLKAKAKEAGLEDIEQLRARSRLEYKVKQKLGNRIPQEVREEERQRKLAAKRSASAGSHPATASEQAPPDAVKPNDRSPVKPLNDIVDLPKLLELPKDKIADVWNGYHQMSKNTVSATIPWELYQTMQATARKFPQFVVPLPREVDGDQLASETDAVGAEMYYMEWAFIPSWDSALQASGQPLHTSTVLYTPLAQYQMHQTFAQPHLILTHYLDLVPSHGIVLMRGDLTDAVSTKLPDAQLLTLRLQQFYQNKHAGRAELLRLFHEEQDKFDIKKLVELVGEV